MSALNDPGDSICYLCTHWDWSLNLDPDEWIDICNSPLECVPGNHVINCPGFEKVKMK